MGNSRKARIIGLGTYLPEKILTNKDLEAAVATSDEWIVSRTGIKERRIASDSEHTSHIGSKSASNALKNAAIDPSEVDLVICATMTPDYIIPSTAALIQNELKLVNAAAYDMQAACTGFIYALSQAKAFVESGLYKNVLIVSAEKMSSFINYKDRNTCVLFGDGAASCVVSGEGRGLFIDTITLGADGELGNLIIIPAGGSRNPARAETVEKDLHFMQMEGREVFKHAVRRMASAIESCLKDSRIAKDEITWLVPHQANMRIINALGKSFDIPESKVYMTLAKYGNTSGSSVAIALSELMEEKAPMTGDNILLVAFGAGLTWGATLLKMIE